MSSRARANRPSQARRFAATLAAASAHRGYRRRQSSQASRIHRSFTLANIEGEVEAIHAECDNRRRTLEYMPDVDWQLPDSWGNCVLFVAGEPDTSFRFLEFLPAQGAP